MLHLARRRSTFPNVAFVCADMACTGLPDRSVDLVTGAYALRHAPDLGATLDEIARVLKPGGTAAFLDFSRPPSAAATWLQGAVLRVWGGAWGLLVHGKPALYAYLADSLDAFPDCPTLYRSLAAHGLPVTNSRGHFAGLLRTILVRRTD